MDKDPAQILMAAAVFAAEQHKYQRRSGYERLPYINHLLKVTRGLMACGETGDPDLLVAALLHDILEDTELTEAALGDRFGARVAAIVAELTDDMRLPHEVRKRLQYEGAHQLSLPARKIRIADKAANIYDIAHYPLEWPHEKKADYLGWAEKIVNRIRGTSPEIERWFDRELAEGKDILNLNSSFT